MFICKDCLNNFYGVIDALAPLSRGPCEECGKIATCYDFPHNALPQRIKPKPKPVWSVS